MRNLFKKIAVLSLCIVLMSCDDDDSQSEVALDNTITGIASRTPNLSILVQALNRTGLAADLQNGTAQLTAFAPTNEAFRVFFQTISPNTDVFNIELTILTRLLQNHLLAIEIKSLDVQANSLTYIPTLSPFGTGTNNIFISMLVQKAGSVVFINGTTENTGVRVITPDIDASNGVVHIVNKVIAVPTIVDHIIANPLLQTLRTAITSTTPTALFGNQSALLTALQGLTPAAPGTVFAPINAAFTTATAVGNTPAQSVFAGAATSAQVTTVLRYHVTTAGNVRANQLMSNQVVPMFTVPIQNTTVILGTETIDIRDITAAPNNLSRVIQADIQASNGVIHTVNRVLRPF